MTETYAGDLGPRAAWALLADDQGAVLIDVRTKPEWAYVGLPDLASIGKQVLKIEWQSWPEGTRNPDFAAAISQAGIAPEQKILLLCRSGVRSKAAAELLTAQGWQHCYNISN